MSNIKNKKILLICPSFYNYATLIYNELKEQGAHVVYYDERPKNSFLYKVSHRLNLSLFFKLTNEKYYSDITNTQLNFTDILIINPEVITPLILTKMKERFKDAKFTLYMWDSIKNKKKSEYIFNIFDKVYSFDKLDSIKYQKINFEPLFYGKNFIIEKSRKINEKYTISFIGSIHSDRLDLIHEIKSLKKTYIFLFSPSIVFSYLKLLTSRKSKLKDIKLISHKKIPITEISNIFRESKAIIDIHHPNQNGLTMRTFEALASGKKLITTNKNITEYNFYHKNNIYILERNNIELKNLDEFINSEFNEQCNANIKSQRIDNWLSRILE